MTDRRRVAAFAGGRKAQTYRCYGRIRNLIEMKCHASRAVSAQFSAQPVENAI